MAWDINWNAISAVGTAAAAFIAVGIWFSASVAERKQRRKRVRVHQQLMAAELVRVSKQATFIYTNHPALAYHLALPGRAEMIFTELDASNALELLKLTDGLTEDFAVTISKLAALVQSLRIVITVEKQALAISKQARGITVPKLAGETERRLKGLSEDTLRQCLLVARALEKHSRAPEGSVERLVQMPTLLLNSMLADGSAKFPG